MCVGDGYGEARVCLLKVGGESKLDILECRVSVDDMELCRDIIRALSEDLNGSWRLRGCETRSAGLHDSTFMPCDLLNSVPQHSGVIDSQTSDAGDGRLDENVGAIVFTANATFDYRGIDLLAHVGVVCHQSQKPEVGRFCSKICRFALRSRSIL